MSALTICFPPQSNPRVPYIKGRQTDAGVVVVSGLATSPITALTRGTCTPRGGGEPIISSRIDYQRGEPVNGTSAVSRWLIVFKLPRPGDYDLVVEAEQGPSLPSVSSPPRSLTAVVLGAPQNEPNPLRAEGLGFEWPADGDLDITDYVDSFVAYGPAPDYGIAAATMTDENNNVIGCTSCTTDPDTEMWVANFPSIPLHHTYTLTVTDVCDPPNVFRLHDIVAN